MRSCRRAVCLRLPIVSFSYPLFYDAECLRENHSGASSCPSDVSVTLPCTRNNACNRSSICGGIAGENYSRR